MTKTLPARPDLAWLKKAAKERLAELRADDPGAKLHQAQLAIAKDYGFPSWRALKAHVDGFSLDGELLAAVVVGDARLLDARLAAHPSKIRVTGSDWNRPLLHLAADKGHLACVDVLIRRGFDVTTRDKFDNATALHWAAQGGHAAVVDRLLDAGADIDAEDDAHGLGVIGWATCFRDVREAVADLLLQRGAKPTIFSAVALGRVDLVRQLVGRNRLLLAERMSRYEEHRTPLHLAVLKNRPEVVKLLLELGADPAAKDHRGSSPLNHAGKVDAEIARSLIAAGASPQDHNANRFQSATPIFNVRDVPASIAYYVDKLGFRVEWDWGTPPTFASVERDAVRIFLCQGGQGAPGTWLSIYVQDIDALYEEYQRRGAIIRQAPANFPWGVREMNVQDLDGHRLRMGADATGPSDGVDLDDGP